jgi:TRAP-type mannitol/chloroaromatic compound transport system permease large subunit
MKKLTGLFLLFLITVVILIGCAKQTEEQPCGGKGTLSIVNKLTDSLSISIVQIHNTIAVSPDYIHPFTLAGNAPYTLVFDAPGYHLDTTMMLLNCDNKFLVIKK